MVIVEYESSSMYLMLAQGYKITKVTKGGKAHMKKEVGQ